MKLTNEQIVRRRLAVNATARTRLGPTVESIEKLADLAQKKRSVYCGIPWGLLPACVVMQMKALEVYSYIKRRSIFEYQPKS